MGKVKTLREKIKSANDKKREKVIISEWGNVNIYVATMTAAAKEQFEGMFVDANGKRKDVDSIRAALAVLTCEAEDGSKLFEPGDEEWLKEKSASALTKLSNAAQALNVMTDGEVEELAKN
jgi:hypothetical protein